MNAHTEALESFASRIGLPMIYVSEGRACCGRVIRDNTPKINTHIRHLRAAIPADRLASVGDEMVARASAAVAAYASMSAEIVRQQIEEDAALTPVKSTAPVRRVSVAMAEIAATLRNSDAGEIEALRVLADVLGV